MIYLFDINATGLNSILTVLSIGCALFSGHCTAKTKKIKKQVYKKLDAFDLVTYSREIHSLNLDISSKIKTANSNKGGRNNKLIEGLNKNWSTSIFLKINYLKNIKKE